MIVRLRAVILALLTVSAACGGTATTTSSPSSAGSTTATAGTASGSPAGGSGSVRTDACALARADVEAVIGTVIGQPLATTNTVPGTTGLSVTACAFASSDGILTFAVTKASVSKSDFENAAKQVPGVQPESGIGDAAFSGNVTSSQSGFGNATALFVLKGSTYFTLQAASRTKDATALRAALRTLATKVASGL